MLDLTWSSVYKLSVNERKQVVNFIKADIDNHQLLIKKCTQQEVEVEVERSQSSAIPPSDILSLSPIGSGSFVNAPVVGSPIISVPSVPSVPQSPLQNADSSFDFAMEDIENNPELVAILDNTPGPTTALLQSPQQPPTAPPLRMRPLGLQSSTIPARPPLAPATLLASAPDTSRSTTKKYLGVNRR